MFVVIDPHLPIVIPFGYACIGKTMLIQRLLRYLRTIGYSVRPELTFRNDPLYPEICNKYMDEINGNKVAAATAANGTILLSIIDGRGMPICYLLDIAGEFQYNTHIPHGGISSEMRFFVHLPNPKIWGFMVDNNNWLNQQQRHCYVQNIRNIASIALSPRNKVLFIYNKVDLTPFVNDNGKVLWRGLFDSADSLYPGIFNPFERKNALLRILKGKFCFRMTPFQTGFFSVSGGSAQFLLGRDEYPKRLWYNILKCIRK